MEKPQIIGVFSSCQDLPFFDPRLSNSELYSFNITVRDRKRIAVVMDSTLFMTKISI